MTTETQKSPAAGAPPAKRYEIPPGHDVRALAETLAASFRARGEVKTELIMIPRGWVVQIMGPEGRLGRWFNREVEFRHVRMVREGNRLNVSLRDGEWSPGADAEPAETPSPQWGDPEAERAVFSCLDESLRA